MSDSVDVVALAFGSHDMGIIVRVLERETERRKIAGDEERRWEYQYLVDHIKRQIKAQKWL